MQKYSETFLSIVKDYDDIFAVGAIIHTNSLNCTSAGKQCYLAFVNCH